MPTISRDVPFTQIPDWIILNPALSHATVRIYCAICTHTRKERTAFPGIRQIAKDANCSTRTVQDAIDELEKIGAITVTRVKDEVNHYHLPLQSLPQGVAVSTTPPVAVTTTEEQASLRTSTKNTIAPKARDELWDTLTQLVGEPGDALRSLQGRFVKRLRAEQATPDDIRQRAERLILMWGPEKLTLASLEKHWGRMGTPIAQVSRADVEKAARRAELARALEQL